MRWPKKTVWWTLGVFLLTQAGRHIGSAPQAVMGVNIPWNAIGLGALTFLAGLLVEDGFYNPKSWIRENLRHWVRSFDVLKVKVYGPGHPSRYEPAVKIRINRTIRNGHLSVVGRKAVGQPRTITSVRVLSEERTFVQGEAIYLPLTAIPIVHGDWTPAIIKEWADFDPDSVKRWAAGAPNSIIEIRLGSGWRWQTERFHLHLASDPTRAFLRWEADEAYDFA